VYARRVGERVLDFGHRGWLFEESFLFYDRQSDSLWVQATGEAVHGQYRGTRLERIPATQSTWTAWRTLHPDTLVLGRPAARSLDFWIDSYATYYRTGRGIRYKRDKPLSFGLAILTPGSPKLYPFAELERNPVLLDHLGVQPVLVVFHAASRTAVAFDPRRRGQVLHFEAPAVQSADVILKDRETGSEWSGLTGRCVGGAAKGEQLTQLTTTQFVVENWPLHYPGAPIYTGPASRAPTEGPRP
jgi:hypothetical protein